MKSFTELTQMNINHYNNHPVRHLAITATYTVGALVVIQKFAQRMGRVDHSTRSGQYAK